MGDKGKKTDAGKQMRIDNREMQSAILRSQGYQEYVGIISVVKANVMAFVTAGPFAVIAVMIYLLVWRKIDFNFTLPFILLLLGGLIISIPAHEFLHGLTWHFFCREKWRSIRFFVIWEYLTPCCHCKEPMTYGRYILGAIMPLLVLGLGIGAAGILLQNSLLLWIGVLNIISAGGDTTIICISLRYRNCLMLDHPTECGFIAFRK